MIYTPAPRPVSSVRSERLPQPPHPSISRPLSRPLPTPTNSSPSLAHLNALYCQTYPTLRFITFVNSRPRSAIVTELEHVLSLPASPVPLPDDYPTATPPLDDAGMLAARREVQGEDWCKECERGLGDVWLIGKARLRGMGVE